jgi:hypothetical protein
MNNILTNIYCHSEVLYLAGSKKNTLNHLQLILINLKLNK